MTDSDRQHPGGTEPPSLEDDEQQLQAVIVDPKDIPPASLARARAHAQKLAVELGRAEPA